MGTLGPVDDPLAAVAALDGVGAAAVQARESLDALLRQPDMRHRSAAVAAESGVRGAGYSARLAGGQAELTDPRMQGALRVNREVPELARLWESSPRQVLARVHMLVARDLVDDPEALGRPRPSVDANRLDQLVQVVLGPTAAPGVVVAAIVHGELRSIRPFGTADGLVARAVERIVLVSSGVDTKAVGIPEAGHWAGARAYESALEAYESGTAHGVAAWVRQCADAYARGADEGLGLLDGQGDHMRAAPQPERRR